MKLAFDLFLMNVTFDFGITNMMMMIAKRVQKQDYCWYHNDYQQ
jgi:hypothetical protein